MRVAQALRAKGFEVFIPMQQRRRQLSDRVKVSLMPIFKSTVFCRCKAQDRIAVLSTPGVSRERARGGLPLRVSDADIEHLRRIADMAYPAEECAPFPNLGDVVQIKGEPLIRGTLIERGDVCRIHLYCESIGRAVSVAVPLQELEFIPAK